MTQNQARTRIRPGRRTAGSSSTPPAAGPFRHESADQAGIPDLEGGAAPVVWSGTSREPLKPALAAHESRRHHRHRHQHDPFASREASSGTISVLEDRATITRLGRGIGKDGGLGQEGIDRTLAALSGYAVLARVHERPFSPSAPRPAPGAQRSDFLCRAAALLDTPVEVIGGEREAALTFLAAKQSFPEAAAQTMVVVDIGAGPRKLSSRIGVPSILAVACPLGLSV